MLPCGGVYSDIRYCLFCVRAFIPLDDNVDEVTTTKIDRQWVGMSRQTEGAFRAFALTPSDGDMLHNTKQTNELVGM